MSNYDYEDLNETKGNCPRCGLPLDGLSKCSNCGLDFSKDKVAVLNNGGEAEKVLEHLYERNTKKKKYAILILIILLAIIGVAVYYIGQSKENQDDYSGWGPERTTYTMEKPATSPTFNSISDNPTIGDERDFVRIGEINKKTTDLGNSVKIEKGKQYLVYIYIHNNASSEYNDEEHNYSGVARDVRISSNYSKTVGPKKEGAVYATVSSSNANPDEVWDGASITADEEVSLKYHSSSAKIYNDWDTNKSQLPTSLFSDKGTFIGLDELNGVVPGCEEYHSVVSYVLDAE